MRFAAIGLDHRHIYDLSRGPARAGATCAGYWPQTTDPRVLEGFRKRFPARSRASTDATRCSTIRRSTRSSRAAVPRDRAAHRDRGDARRQGRDGRQAGRDRRSRQLDAVRRARRETGRIFSICFSERLRSCRLTEVAAKLVADGAIGRVMQTVGLGPHRLNRAIRPAWFFDPTPTAASSPTSPRTRSTSSCSSPARRRARSSRSAIGNFGTPDVPEFEDFGEIVLRSDRAQRLHARRLVHARRPADLGRRPLLIILGTEGYDRAAQICRHRRARRHRPPVPGRPRAARATSTAAASR